MTAYYNEIDPNAVEWLRVLISEGHIAPGDVDTRSISDVRPSDLEGYAQCHFFAGIGGWSLALRMAGIPDDFPIWTGSCPCQPFSAAGKRGGVADERHLWPHWFHLIHQRRPPKIVGEQVASKDGLAWLDLVFADLEGAGYAACAADMCAAGVGAPHIRQRLWFYGGRLADRFGNGWLEGRLHDGRDRAAIGSGTQPVAGNARAIVGLEHHTGVGRDQRGTESGERRVMPGCGVGTERPGAVHHGWQDADWLLCRDERWRPVEPGTFPLADGVSGRVGLLRGYGNAIVPQVAATFLEAVRDL